MKNVTQGDERAEKETMRFYILDLIRFLAALGVVFFHYTYSASNPNPDYQSLVAFTQFGYLGVPLFFMISGFVICASALNRTPIEFAIARGTRLYPTVFICLTLTVICVSLVEPVIKEITPLAYFSNLTLLNTYIGIDYIDGSYWTLLVELKFYACVFLLLHFGVFERFKYWLTIWLLFTFSFILFSQPFFLGWFISPENSAYFIAGIVFFLATKNGYDRYSIGLLVGAWIAAMYWADQQAGAFLPYSTPMEHLLAQIIESFFFVLFWLISIGKLRLRSSRTLLLLGGMTYPLYLIHSLIGDLLFRELQPWFGSYQILVVVIFLMLFLSLIIHVFLEQRLANVCKCYLLSILSRDMDRKSRAENFREEQKGFD